MSGVLPREIRLLPRQRCLEMVWADGAVDRISYRALRAGCRCADCERSRRSGFAVTVEESIDVLQLQACGQNALWFRFSDGHERGIYPFAYLLELRSAAADAR